MEQWGKDRSSGFRALLEYPGTIHSMAQDHIANHIVQARTPEHKLEVALAMRSTLAQVPVNEARISKLCTRDAELMDIVVLRLDLEI